MLIKSDQRHGVTIERPGQDTLALKAGQCVSLVPIMVRYATHDGQRLTAEWITE